MTKNVQSKNKGKRSNTTKKVNKKSPGQGFNWKNPRFISLVIIALLLIFSYFAIGLILTIIMALGIGIIIGVARLLDKTKSKAKQRKILNIVLIIILSIGIFGCVTVGGFLAYVVIKAPSFNESQLNSKESTIYYDKDGEVITKLGTEMREKIDYDDLPQVLVDAIIATEDSRFFQHNGFDAPRFLSASLKQVAGNADAGGASTLSMQVIKNTFTSTTSTGIKGIIRKFSDIYLAVFKLEKNYTKEQIIEFYVNNHFLGGNVYGVQQASQAYFGKDVRDLNLTEAAILAGMFKAPNSYRPDTMPEQATKRRETVLYLMRRHGYISKEEEAIANSIPVSSLVDTVSQVSAEFQGYIDTVTEEIEDRYGVNPYVTPMLVYTNMDREKQRGVDRVMNGQGFDWVDDVIQSGVSVMDVHSGKILAIGAGRNKSGANTFNFATFSSTPNKRQPGSTAKPIFDYGPGIEFNNWSTYTLFVDEPYSYSGGKSIQNWDGSFMGTLTLRRALALSRNIPALKAFQQVDNAKIRSFAEGLGIQPEVDENTGRLHEAHALGAFNGVSPVQLGAAYGAFANGGYYYAPYTVNKVVFRDTGETKEYSSERKKAMSDSTAFMITDVLKDVAVGNIPNVTFAAKTGTTNYDDKTMEAHNLPSDAISDSWIVGYTPDTLISVWYGYEKIDSVYVSHNLPMSNQKNRLFVALGKEIFDKSNKQFTVPSSVVRVCIEGGSNPPKLASPNSGNAVCEYFKKGTEPTETANVQTNLDAPSNLKVTYDERADKISITWNRVNAVGAQESYGPLGYNVYFNDKLLGFTEKNSYTITKPEQPYGTYKVVATYKSYNGNQSSPSTFTLKDPNSSGGSSGNDPSTEVSYSSSLKVSNKESVTLPSSGYYIADGKDVINVFENSKNVTSQATITYTVTDGTGKVAAEPIESPGVYTVTYTVKYKTYTATHVRIITINN